MRLDRRLAHGQRPGDLRFGWPPRDEPQHVARRGSARRPHGDPDQRRGQHPGQSARRPAGLPGGYDPEAGPSPARAWATPGLIVVVGARLFSGCGPSTFSAPLGRWMLGRDHREHPDRQLILLAVAMLLA